MTNIKDLKNRQSTWFTSTISGDKNGQTQILGEDLTKLAINNSFSYLVGSMLLGRKLKSEKTEELIDLILKLLIDHGPYQSGPVNTMIAARAGKDLVSALAAGLLTIGNRFGGAVNNAAWIWFKAVAEKTEAYQLVSKLAKQKQYVPGIGHRKYRLDMPDPRVKLLKQKGESLTTHIHLDFALQVEKVTTAKKANLILNVDGAIAAIMLDFLSIEEGLNTEEIEKLIRAEFFNAFFVLSRSVGLVAHYLDQKRLNEPLFRLTAKEIFTL